MDKQTFIGTLRDGLRGMPQEDINEIISEFEEHFAMALSQGKTEEDITQHLGNPVRIAAAYRGDGAVDVDADEPRRGGSYSAGGQGSYSGHGERTSYDRYASIHERYPLKDVRDIDIDMLSSDISVVDSQGDRIEVDIEGKTRGGISVSLSGGHLLICQEFRLFDFFQWINHEPEVVIKLPAAYRGAISLSTKSGEIDAGDFEGESLAAGSASGNISLGFVKARTLQAKTVSGELSLMGFDGESTDIGSVSGDVSFGNISANRLSLNNVSGDTNQMSGRVVDAKIISQNSVSGDLALRLTDRWEQINASSVSGDLNLKMPEGERFSVELSSVSGDVDNQLGSDPRATRRIRAKTVSGDLTIERI